MKAKHPATNRPPPAKNRPPPSGNENLLLARLPAADYARLVPLLEVVPLKLKDFLQKPGESSSTCSSLVAATCPS